MPYLDDLLKSGLPKQTEAEIGLRKGQAYSGFFPQWETQTPSYVSPNAYAVTQATYRTNEFVYSLILKRAMAVNQCPLWVFDVNKENETPEEIPDHGIRQFLKSVNQFLPESYFWGISEMSRCIAGFAAWEIETDNKGDPIKAYWMRPDFCSFIRDQHKPLAYIKYQPYGLQPYNIPIDNILFMYQQENFDPLFPFIKWVSPAMLALPQINVDTGMTHFLDDFIKRGARFGGLISVAQVLTGASAKEIQERWAERHGGSENWSQPLVLGQGADYKPMQMNFDEMAFPQLDARTETRICSAFSISPIVADARAGLDVSSYNNKAQATKDWYNEWVLPTLNAYQDSFGSQMLPRYHDDPENYQCKFHTDELYALQEDKVVARNFWLDAFTKKAVTKNEMREKLDMDPVEGGDEFEKPPMLGLPGQPGLPGQDITGKELPGAVVDQAKQEDTTTNENATMQEDKAKAAPETTPEKKPAEKKGGVGSGDLEGHEFRGNQYTNVLLEGHDQPFGSTSDAHLESDNGNALINSIRVGDMETSVLLAKAWETKDDNPINEKENIIARAELVRRSIIEREDARQRRLASGEVGPAWSGAGQIAQINNIDPYKKPKKKSITSEEAIEEELNFHKFATKRIKELKYNDVLEFEFKYATLERQKELIQEVQAGAVLKMLRDAIKGGAGSGNFDHEGRPGLVGGSGEGDENKDRGSKIKTHGVRSLNGTITIQHHWENGKYEVNQTINKSKSGISKNNEVISKETGEILSPNSGIGAEMFKLFVNAKIDQEVYDDMPKEEVESV